MADVAITGIPIVTPASGDTVLGVQGGLVKRMAVGGSGIAGLGVDQTFTGLQTFEDAVGSAASLLDVRHHSNGTGNTSSPGQTYGLDIHNYDGARQAVVIHQYSNVAEALRIDNTDNQPAISIYNTENLTLNPDGIGSGLFLRCDDHGTVRFQMRGDGTVTVVQKAASTDQCLRLELNSAGALGMEIVANAGAAGVYPLQVTGQNYGPKFSTASSGGQTLTLTKTGASGGEVLYIANSGTGKSIAVRSGSAELFAITAAGLPQWTAAANQQTTVGAAGAASALPATPTKYLKVVDSAGTTYVIPAYAAS